ncbi:MAG: hypothetical protein RR246_00140, partial [Clostridia bacterium]
SGFRRGEHSNDPITTLIQCKTLKIAAPEIINVNIDGEIVKIKDPEIKINPSCLKIILPKNK